MHEDEDKEQAVVPHPHKSRVSRVFILDTFTTQTVESCYWKASCPICGDLSLHTNWHRAVISASDHPQLWEFVEKQRKKLYAPKLYAPKNEISDRFYPR